MSAIDRILTILVTATLTSAVWIVAGGSLIEYAGAASQRDVTRPAEAAPSPSGAGDDSAASRGMDRPISEEARRSRPLDTQFADATPSGGDGNLVIPVLNVRASDLTDSFTDARGGGARVHEAIDIMAPIGTSVVAAAPGMVERLFRSDAGGNTIYIRSADRRTIHYYAHLDAYAQGLREGQRVRRGQRIGTVGSSGNASRDAPHLHFAILRTTPDAQWWEPASAVNPFPLLAR